MESCKPTVLPRLCNYPRYALLRYIGTLPYSPPHYFYKGRQLLWPLSVSLDDTTLPKGANSYRKEFAPRGANSFLSELTPVDKGGKTKNGRVASPESVPIHLKMCGYTIMESSSTHLFLQPISMWVQLVKERICTFRSKFFSLKVDPIWEDSFPGETNTKIT